MINEELRKEGESLQAFFNSFGVATTLESAETSPQEYNFKFTGGIFSNSALNRAAGLLYNFNGYKLARDPRGGFWLSRLRKNRKYTYYEDCQAGIMQAMGVDESLRSVPPDCSAKSDCWLNFGETSGGYIVESLARCAHILIAGTTGSGKSCLLNSLICQLIVFSNAYIYLIDPKGGAELGIYAGEWSNHIVDVAKDARETQKALRFAAREMDNRYTEMGEKLLKVYDGDPLVVVIDELADLMILNKEGIEKLLIRIAQKGRAAKVHLIIATQDPRASVVTGLIKYNLPTKICLKTANKRHSMNVIDVGAGAELLGNGDALIKLPTNPDLIRCQCPYISDETIKELLRKGE